MEGAVGGQPTSPALLPAGHSWTRTDGAQHKSPRWNNRSSRPGLHLEGGSRAKRGNSHKCKRQQEIQGTSRGEGTIPSPFTALSARVPPGLGALPGPTDLVWWNGCLPHQLALLLSPRLKKNWKMKEVIERLRQDRPETGNQRCVTTLCCRAPSLLASPIDHSNLCPATISSGLLQHWMDWAPPTVFTRPK